MDPETQLEGKNGAAEGNVGSSQETPKENKLLETVETLSKKLDENSQVLKTIQMRERELRDHPHTPPKEDPAEEERELAELREIMEKPPEEAARLLAKRSKKERETFNKMLKEKESEIVNNVSQKIKTDINIDVQVETAKKKVLSEYPHLAKHYEEIGLRAAKIFHSKPGTSIQESMEMAAKEFHSTFVEYHENEKKKNNPHGTVSPGAVSETAGKPNKTRSPEPSVKGAPKDLNEYYEREQARRAMKNNLKI